MSIYNETSRQSSDHSGRARIFPAVRGSFRQCSEFRSSERQFEVASVLKICICILDHIFKLWIIDFLTMQYFSIFDSYHPLEIIVYWFFTTVIDRCKLPVDRQRLCRFCVQKSGRNRRGHVGWSSSEAKWACPPTGFYVQYFSSSFSVDRGTRIIYVSQRIEHIFLDISLLLGESSQSRPPKKNKKKCKNMCSLFK